MVAGADSVKQWSICPASSVGFQTGRGALAGASQVYGPVSCMAQCRVWPSVVYGPVSRMAQCRVWTRPVGARFSLAVVAAFHRLGGLLPV